MSPLRSTVNYSSLSPLVRNLIADGWINAVKKAVRKSAAGNEERSREAELAPLTWFLFPAARSNGERGYGDFNASAQQWKLLLSLSPDT